MLLAYEIEKLKQIELAMLKEFLKICAKENLLYFAIGGTALGAVRHGGFIPWDDDIDIGMPREDYKKFLKVAPRYLPEHLFVQHIDSEPNCPFNFAKIRNSQTTFIEKSCKNIKMNQGVFIDIFPLDGYNHGSLSKKLFKLKNILLTTSVNKMFFGLERRCSFKGRLLRLIAKLYCNSPQKALRKREGMYQKHSFSNCEKVVNYSGILGEKEIIEKNVYGKGTVWTFEGINILLPAETDKYLTHLYGDYMTPPPVEKRVSHHYTEVLDLDNSFRNYM